MWNYNVANNNGLCVMWYEIYYRYRNNDQQWFTCNLLTKYWKKQMKYHAWISSTNCHTTTGL